MAKTFKWISYGLSLVCCVLIGGCAAGINTFASWVIFFAFIAYILFTAIYYDLKEQERNKNA